MNSSISRLLSTVSLAFVFYLCGLSIAQATSQSPIDICSGNTYYGKLPPLQFNLSSDASLSLVNTGSPHMDATIKAKADGEVGTLTISGNQWNLVQFHFHAHSEHLQNSHDFPMELHLVFNNADGNYLVVGRWIKDGYYNHAMEPIFAHLPSAESEEYHIDHFNLNVLLPDSFESFRYSGSLTTPPYTEGVNWVYLTQPLELSKSQILAFSKLFPQGDAREPQELDGRVVLTDVSGFVSTRCNCRDCEEETVRDDTKHLWENLWRSFFF